MARSDNSSVRRPTPSLEAAPGCVGVDEAGRGPLAGPVVCAAVLLDGSEDLEGLNDSKALPPSQREALSVKIKERARGWCIQVVSAREIDKLNILAASLMGMMRSVAGLHLSAPRVLVDGNRLPPVIAAHWECVVKGDAKYQCIAAASILAKVERDALMRAYAKEYPAYGFDSNFGYPTEAHKEAIFSHGPCPIHRRSFAPLKDDYSRGPSRQLCLPLGN